MGNAEERPVEEDPDLPAGGVMSSIPLPRARISQMDRLLAECGLISGPWATVKHAGKTGLRVVGLETAESQTESGPRETA
jgi:hypothetical protein